MFIIQIILIAISLSMDAVSLAISLTINKKIYIYSKYAIAVGLFHFFMPLIGYITKCLIGFIINIPSKELFIGVLVFLIIEILISKKNKDNKLINPILFAFTVSIDSYSIGLSTDKHLLISCFIYMLISGTLTYVAFYLGNKISSNIENKSKIISVSILFILLIKTLLNM